MGEHFCEIFPGKVKDHEAVLDRLGPVLVAQDPRGGGIEDDGTARDGREPGAKF